MNLDGLVEVTSVFPSPLGGAVFKGIRVGERKPISFRASYKVIVRTPRVGEFWRVTGDEIICTEYGVVVIVNSATLTNLPSSKLIGNLLSKHDAFRGFAFGRAKVNKIVDAIGDYALVDLLNNGNYLAIADAGLNVEISRRVCEAWSTLKEEAELATFLAEHKIDSSTAAKITRLCRYNVVERLKRNPYALLALSKSTLSVLKLISRVALKLGVPPDDSRASIGLTEFVLYQQLECGHTMVALDELKRRLRKLRHIIGSKLDPESIVSAALRSKAACVYEENGRVFIQPIGVAYIEKSVEHVLLQLQKTPVQESVFDAHSGVRQRIEEYNLQHKCHYGYVLTEQQCCAVEMALTNRISILAGFGGTGKTTVLKAIVSLAEENGIAVHVCALAGKAADRARQAIGRDTYTIHNLIAKLKKRVGTKKSGNVDRTADPLVVIDEGSMVDIALAGSLLSAFEGHPFRLLVVGDTAQLPPIGFGLFWHVLVNANIPKINLTLVHRVLNDSPLHKSAMKIRNGVTHQIHAFEGQESGIYILNHGGDVVKAVAGLRKGIDAVTLTAFSNERYTGSAKAINKVLQDMLNGTEGMLSMYLGAVRIRANDPVIATVNVNSLGIYNGMMGIVKSIHVNQSGEVLCDVQFECREVLTFTQTTCWEVGLDLAYAMTIHKSQGSEYDACIICLSDRMERSALYTAITRAKKLCIVVGTQQQFDQAILRQPSYEKINCGFRI